MSPVRFRVLIRYQTQNYHLATISINVAGGDSYYFPSNEIIPGQSYSRELLGKPIDHFTLMHKDGRRHIKDKFGKKYILDPLLPIHEIGYQELIRESVWNILELPRINGTKVSDCILDLSTKFGVGVLLKVSVISGRLIADGSAIATSVGERDLISALHRCLGKESDNADKLIQLSLHRWTSSLPSTNIRNVVLPGAMKIRRPSFR